MGGLKISVDMPVKNIAGFKEEVEKSLATSISRLLGVVLGGAALLDVSDIHLEPEKEGAKIRIRIDGILRDVAMIDRKTYENLVPRIKLLSGIKLNITDYPQNGRFSLMLGETAIDIRTSSLPAEYGETIVLRVLNPKSLIGMKDLGLRSDLLKICEGEIKKTNGMIVVTGPTGSGKTTTLYAFLKKINRPEIKIITIEDPIEYHLEGISQTQVNPDQGYDFANGLKSIMRQDPNVILVGEIRDLETAKIATQAALTGHLVFSTLHANDAIGTIARLINLGAKAPDLGAALNLVIAQRLVRKICPKCRQLKKPSSQELDKIKRGLRGLPENILAPQISPKTKIPKIKGCRDCSFTGYSGRIGIFEIFLIDDSMKKLIVANSSVLDLKKSAVKKGMVLARQDGFIKVLQGITTLEEIERVAP